MEQTAASPIQRRALQTVLLALGVLALVSGVLTLSGRTTVSAEARVGALPMEMKDFQFAPNRLQAKAGESVRLVVANADTALHTFTIRGLGINTTVAPGNEALIEFQAPSAGVYTWICVPHASSEGGMTGTLIVK
jgi:plastocyanin